MALTKEILSLWESLLAEKPKELELKSKVHDLEAFAKSPVWQDFKSYFDHKIELTKELFVEADSLEEVRIYQGSIKAFRLALEAPTTLLELLLSKQEQQAQEEKDNE